MRAGLWSGRTVRWVIGVVIVSFVATSIALGVSTRVGDVKVAKPAPAPAPLSIDAALTVVTTASSFFLRIPTIKGESSNDKHKDEIDIPSLSWGLTNAAGTATGGAFNDIVVSKGLDRASPLLFKAAAAGTNLGTTVITAQKTGEQSIIYLTLTLTNTKVRAFHESANSTGGINESISLGFTQLKMTYGYQGSDGTTTPVTGCWNLSTHAGC